MYRRNVGVKWGVDLEEARYAIPSSPSNMGTASRHPATKRRAPVPRRLCLITCETLTTALLVSSTSEATQPRTPPPNPMVI
jgi:hypothetical protein